jgi:hypothetical protein
MIKNDLISKSPLEFPRKNYDVLLTLIESKRKSKGRKKKSVVISSNSRLTSKKIQKILMVIRILTSNARHKNQ